MIVGAEQERPEADEVPRSAGAAPWDGLPWCSALTLGERVALLREHPGAAGSDGSGEWRLGEWLGQAPFDTRDGLLQRLQADGITGDEFAAAVRTPAAALAGAVSGLPEWAEALVTTVLRGCRPEAAEGAPADSLGSVLHPFLVAAVRHVAEQAASLAEGEAPFEPEEAAALLSGSLGAQVSQLFVRVLALEIQVARLQGVLVGSSPAERFASFVERLRDPDRMLELLTEYAPAARLLALQCEQWVRNSVELLRRLRDDRAEIEAVLLDGGALGKLREVRNSGVGDLHGGGKSVAILTFSSGVTVVYKPRSLGTDLAFTAWLDRLNRAQPCPALRAPRVVSRAEHGWAEYVQAAECRTAVEVERFYERLGGLLAVLYALDGRDMHLENVIAAGEHPMIVDLETLCHPGEEAFSDGVRQGEGNGNAPGSPMGADRVLSRSVLATGLLPQWLPSKGGGSDLDVSAMGAGEAQVIAGGGIGLAGLGTDEVRVERVDRMLAAAQNRPRLATASVAPTRFAAQVERGFARVYRALVAERDRVGTEELLRPFADTVVRVVMRATRNYATLLQESFHPDLLRDALDRDRFFDKLWLAVAQRPELKRLIALEQAALRRGDIPAFYTRVRERALLSDGGERVEEFFHATGLERVAERLSAMGEDDLRRQLWVIRASMSTRAGDEEDAARAPGRPVRVVERAEEPSPASANDAAAREVLVRQVGSIADRLCALAVREGRSASWLSLTSHGGGRARVGASRLDLESGLPGIVWLLAAAGEACRTERFAGVQAGALASLGELLNGGLEEDTGPGALSALGGVLFALGQLPPSTRGRTAEGLADRIIGRTAGLLACESRLGVADGAAGAVLGLLSYGAATERGDAVAAALRGAERIISLGGSPEAVASLTPASDSWPARFAYGAPGVAWALLRAAQVAGAAHLRDFALDTAEKVWAGAEASPATRAAMLPAMAAAVRGGESCWEDRARAAAGELLASHGPARHHALWGGTLGLVELLSSAGGVVAGCERTRLAPLVDCAVSEAAAGGWRCGHPLRVEGPGLARGLAGIGVGLLRHAFPGRWESPLTLAPDTPPRAGQ